MPQYPCANIRMATHPRILESCARWALERWLGLPVSSATPPLMWSRAACRSRLSFSSIRSLPIFLFFFVTPCDFSFAHALEPGRAQQIPQQPALRAAGMARGRGHAHWWTQNVRLVSYLFILAPCNVSLQRGHLMWPSPPCPISFLSLMTASLPCSLFPC